MKTFIFYTSEGYTESPDCGAIDNCQLLGEAKGESAKEALDNLLKENPWIIENGFHIGKGLITARELANSCRAIL